VSEQQQKEKSSEKTKNTETTVSTIPKDFEDLEALKTRLSREELDRTEMLKLKQRIAKLEAQVRARTKASAEKTAESTGVKMVQGVEVMSPELRAILPPWTKKPWMWTTPQDEKMKEQFCDRWGVFIMKFTRAKEIYLIAVKDFLDYYPFNNPIKNKSLDENQLIDIGDHLVNKEHAVWWGKAKKRLRVYWQSLEETADIIYDWALLGGREVTTLFDLAEAKQKWSNVPPPDFVKIIDILVEDKRAQWVDDEKKVFTFLF